MSSNNAPAGESGFVTSNHKTEGLTPSGGSTFNDANNYILYSREIRTSHLNLDTPCVEIGGDSREFRGLLSHHLYVTIPRGSKIHLCHACHNGKCSNINHLYYGTPSDNVFDLVQTSKYKSIRDNTIAKCGEDEYKAMMRKASVKGGKAAGGRNKLSNEKLQDIKQIIDAEPKTHGYIVRLEKKLNVSHTHVRRYIKMIEKI